MSDQEDTTDPSADDAANVETRTFKRLERLRELRIEHRDLDDVIHRLQMDLYVNEVQLRRLKKRKLMVKDQIARMESELIPDLNA
ncbi:MAG: YdcH family protein [Steroidobacteraceae bacterium]